MKLRRILLVVYLSAVALTLARVLRGTPDAASVVFLVANLAACTLMQAASVVAAVIDRLAEGRCRWELNRWRLWREGR